LSLKTETTRFKLRESNAETAINAILQCATERKVAINHQNSNQYILDLLPNCLVKTVCLLENTCYSSALQSFLLWCTLKDVL